MAKKKSRPSAKAKPPKGKPVLANVGAQPFLSAIAAAGDDDAPRLAYADWLEERGDLQAEFIRLQSTLATLPDYDPGAVELKLREEELMLRNYRRWESNLLAVAEPVAFRAKEHPDNRSSYYRRGFFAILPTTVKQFLRSGANWFQAAPGLCGLEIPCPASTDEAWKAAELAAGRLTELSLSGVEPEPFEALLNAGILTNVRTLRLKCDEEETPAIGKLLGACRSAQKLRSLNIDGDLGKAGLQAIVGSERLGALQSLTLGQASAATLRTLAESPRSSQLEHLEIDADDIGNEEIAALAKSSHFKSLKSLSMTWIRGMTSASAAALSKSAWWAGLRKLVLVGTVGDAQAASLIPPLKNLEYLDLSETADAAAEAIARSSSLKKLSYLALSLQESLTDRGLTRLVGSKNLAELRVLKLAHVDLTEGAAASLADSRRLAKLHTLAIESSEESAIVRLLARPGFADSLRDLEIGGAALTDGMVDALVRSPISGLRKLSMNSSNLLTDRTADLLGQATNLRHLYELDISYNNKLSTTATGRLLNSSAFQLAALVLSKQKRKDLEPKFGDRIKFWSC